MNQALMTKDELLAAKVDMERMLTNSHPVGEGFYALWTAYEDLCAEIQGRAKAARARRGYRWMHPAWRRHDSRGAQRTFHALRMLDLAFQPASAVLFLNSDLTF